MEASPPIPAPLDDDDEDVSLALSTAGTLWARGEHEDALRWLRRAAETASDVDADARALELFKAAAEVTSKLSTLAASEKATAPPDAPRSAASPPASISSASPNTGAVPVTEAPKAVSPKAAPPPLPHRAAQAVNISPPLPGGRRATRGGAARMTHSAAPQVASSTAGVVTPPASAARPTQVAARPALRPRTQDGASPAPSSQQSQSLQPGDVSPTAPAPPLAARGVVQPPNEGGQRSSQVAPPPTAGRSSTPPILDGTSRPGASQATSARPALPRGIAPPGQPQLRVRGRLGERRTSTADDEVSAQRERLNLAGGSDDLDEETAIIEGTGPAGGSLETLLRGRAQPSDGSEPQEEPRTTMMAARVRPSAAPLDSKRQDEIEGDTSDGSTDAGPSRKVRPASAAAQLAHGSASTAAQSRFAPAASQAQPSPVLPAVRVAVLGMPSGEVRLIAVGPQGQAPAGSLLAILVPLNESEGGAIAKLLGVL